MKIMVCHRNAYICTSIKSNLIRLHWVVGVNYHYVLFKAKPFPLEECAWQSPSWLISADWRQKLCSCHFHALVNVDIHSDTVKMLISRTDIHHSEFKRKKKKPKRLSAEHSRFHTHLFTCGLLLGPTARQAGPSGNPQQTVASNRLLLH